MIKLYLSLHEFFEKGSATSSIVLFTLNPDHRGRYNLASNANYDIRKKLEQYSYFSMYPDRLYEYNALKKDNKQAKFANKVFSYIPQHVKKTIDRLDGKTEFVYYQQFHLSTLDKAFL